MDSVRRAEIERMAELLMVAVYGSGGDDVVTPEGAMFIAKNAFEHAAMFYIARDNWRGRYPITGAGR